MTLVIFIAFGEIIICCIYRLKGLLFVWISVWLQFTIILILQYAILVYMLFVVFLHFYIKLWKTMGIMILYGLMYCRYLVSIFEFNVICLLYLFTHNIEIDICAVVSFGCFAFLYPGNK